MLYYHKNKRSQFGGDQMSIDIEQKKKALDAALLQIEKQYGK